MNKRLLIGITASLFFLWLAVRKVNFQEFGHALAQVRLGYVIPAFLLTLVVCLLRAYRWRLLFSEVKPIPVGRLLSVIMIGFLANNVMPARLGDLAMAHLMGSREDISRSLALGTIFIDRLLDVAALVLLLAMSVFFLFSHVPTWIARIEILGALLLCGAFLVVWLSVARKESAARLLGFMVNPLPIALRDRVLQIYSRFVDGLAVLSRAPVLAKAVGLSVLIWLCLALGVYLIFLAFGFMMGPVAAVIVLAIVNLGLVIPSAPASIGTFQFFCVAALALFRIEESTALSFSVIYHLSQFVPTTLVGLYFLNRENLSFHRLARVGAVQRSAVSPS